MGKPLNFSYISHQSLLGRALRWPFQFIPGETILPILQGRLRGARWIVGSLNHGAWLGSYELKKRELFEKTVRPGFVVFDIGAHVGYYTLLASRLVGAEGTVIAFEPLPRNLRYLKQHLEMNKASNVRLIEAAVTRSTGTARFEQRPSHAMGGLSMQGDLTVATVSIDELCAKAGIPRPDVIKMDIEGGEADALLGMRAVLEQSKPTIFLATHGPEVHQRCLEFLGSLGYALTPVNGPSLEESDEVFCTPG